MSTPTLTPEEILFVYELLLKDDCDFVYVTDIEYEQRSVGLQLLKKLRTHILSVMSESTRLSSTEIFNKWCNKQRQVIEKKTQEKETVSAKKEQIVKRLQELSEIEVDDGLDNVLLKEREELMSQLRELNNAEKNDKQLLKG